MIDKLQGPAEFSVTYSGVALDENLMDVKDLAPALLSLGQAFERANSLVNGDKATINLHIKALSPGSFDISLVLTQMLQQGAAAAPFSWEWITNGNALAGLLIGTPLGAFGLIKLIKELKGKKAKQTESTESKDCIVFEADNIKLTVPKEVAQLYNDKLTRDQIEGVIRPLSKAGIDRVVFNQNKKKIIEINSIESEYFVSPDDSKESKDILLPRQRLQMRGLKFYKNTLELNDGANNHLYAINDQGFIADIERGKTFGKYDILICDVLMTQKVMADGKLKSGFSIIKVFDHISAGKQLPFSEGERNS